MYNWNGCKVISKRLSWMDFKRKSLHPMLPPKGINYHTSHFILHFLIIQLSILDLLAITSNHNQKPYTMTLTMYRMHPSTLLTSGIPSRSLRIVKWRIWYLALVPFRYEASRRYSNSKKVPNTEKGSDAPIILEACKGIQPPVKSVVKDTTPIQKHQHHQKQPQQQKISNVTSYSASNVNMDQLDALLCDIDVDGAYKHATHKYHNLYEGASIPISVALIIHLCL